MRYPVGYVLCVLGLALPAAGSGRAQWNAHTSLRDVRALAPAADAMWAGSSGGVFRYDSSTGEIARYTAAEGLHDVQTRTISYDAQRDVVWAGYADGVIDRLDVATGVVRTFFDIRRSDRFPSREINKLYIYGDTLFLATAFGLVVFDAARGEVRDTYSQLGTLASPVAVRDVVIADVPQGGTGIWLATDQGVAHALLAAPNLQDPAAWAVEPHVEPSSDLYAISEFDGTIYVGTQYGLSRRDGDDRYSNTELTSRTIFGMATLADRLLVLTSYQVLGVFASGGAIVQADGFISLRSVAVAANGHMWVGDAETGLNHYERPSGNNRPALITGEIYPSGPYDSPFGDITVDVDGNLWAAAVEGLPRSGFYKLQHDGVWISYTQRFFEELSGHSNFLEVYTDKLGNAWAGSRGGGLAQVDANRVISLYDQTNSSLMPVAGEADFIIVSGIAADRDGTLWVTNTASPEPLHIRTPDGTWTSLPPVVCSGLGATTALGNIMVDSSGFKWIVVQNHTDLRLTVGVLALDTGDMPTDPTDDKCQFFGETGSSGRGLPSAQINALTEDRDGRIWVGTDEGPAYFFSSTLVTTGGSAQASWPIWTDGSRTTYMLRGLTVNDLVQDPSGQLWFATNDGVYVVGNQGGFVLTEHFTVSNSPLLSDNVNAVDVNGATGLVFLATDKGLISYQSNAIDPASHVRDLFVYPNPLKLSGDRPGEVFIEGLVAETDIKILAVHGEVVAQFTARGGKVVWDGRDRNGQTVPSGVYLIVAVGRSGEGTAYGKVAVIR